MMQRITPFLWFDHQAEEVARFYVSIFNEARITNMTRYGEAGFEAHGQPAGRVMTVEFELDGQRFTALNGGPDHPITDAISFVVNCETQAEIDAYWDKLSAGGTVIQCGWLTDRYGVSWQVVPTNLARLISDPEHPGKSARVMEAMLQMIKLDIDALQQAYDAGE